jgi:hypothetical protein
MHKQYLLLLLILFTINYSLQNQNNVSIQKNKVNIYGEFHGRSYDNILLDNKTDITLYEKPPTEEGDPNLLQYTKSLIPNLDNSGVYIKQIQYVPQVIKEIKTVNSPPLTYYKQKWYEVKITFSNNEVKNYLLPVSTRITMTDTVLGMHSNIKISGLSEEGIIIKGIKQEKNKKKDDNENEKK